MRTLKIVTILMAVLIVGATALLGLLIARRISAPSAAAQGQVMLAEPPGTRITGIAQAGPSIALTLQGGGPDRVILLNPQTLKVTARLSLPQ